MSMRLLHTSDWHLGQSFHQFERSHEHERFLAWLLDTLVEESVDVLLIAGDVFDNANPSAAAQTQLYRFLTEARRRVPHLVIVMTAGNHDSALRLEAPSPFMSLIGAHVVGQVSRPDSVEALERVVVPLTNREGEVAAWCIAMPFLRPGDVPRVDGGEEGGDAYAAGIETLYRQAMAFACAKREPGQAIVALGHCHVSGGQVSEESERRIVIGDAEALPVAIFDPAIAYVALGHLHLAQQVGGDPSRRYCGSPLPMSFSEVDYPHQVVVFDLDGEVATNIRPRHIPRVVELLRVPKRPAALEVALAELNALDLPERPECEWPFLQVRVQLGQPEPGLRTQVEAAIEGKPVRLARIETSYMRDESSDAAAPVSLDALNSLEPADFFQRLYRQKIGSDVPAEIMAAFAELMNSAPEAEV
ncbi:exonuclease SbcCD subunit D C-terminal domain-containing protein [Rhodocyclus purpureus]|uniref:exonuclease SbcCD subunit D C-terminal domain-containing protein n=1 Tax=Rhodocyclus purpureus TaxID=1067 RepID=UPI001F5DF340|nr:exonuclease SbcCD subunit D C-terminal domain-containing protein [Rhodocyclus purpureus]